MAIPITGSTLRGYSRPGFVNGALGQKQTFAVHKLTSALPPKATLIACFGMSALGQKRRLAKHFDIQTLHRWKKQSPGSGRPSRSFPLSGRALDYDDIAASAASAARRLSRSCSRLFPASAAAASNAVRASS